MKIIKVEAALILVLGIFFSVVIQSNGQTGSEMAVPIKMDNVPLTTAIEVLAREAVTNYILTPKLFENPDGTLTEPPLTFYWKDLSYRQALARVLKEHDLKMISIPGTTVVLIARTNQIVNHIDASLLGDDTVTNSSPPIVLQDVPLDEALKVLVRVAKVNAALDPKLSGYVDDKGQMVATPTVTVRWENVTYKQAIVALCETFNLVIVKDSTTGAITIKPKN